MKKIIFILLFSNTFIFSEEFKFKFDESYRIESTVYQNVLFNRDIQLSSIILNKYSVNVIEDRVDSGTLNVSHNVFQESDGISSGFYSFQESEEGIIEQESNGMMSAEANPYFPAVQNVPFFPDRDIKIGESWTSYGIEYFNLKNGFNIDAVISTEFRVFYTYLENRVIEGLNIAVIKMNYNIYEKIKPYISWGDFYPVKITGGSNQILYWDIEKGRPYKVDDQFIIDFHTSAGDKFTFKGNTESKSWPENDLKSDNVLNLIKTLNNTPQTTVVDNIDYLTITFNSLLFEAESSILKNSVKQYLDKIGETFKSMGDVNIRVLGHTAIFGEIDEQYLSDLSTRRAKAVAEYLLDNNYIDKNSVEIKGMGGNLPVDTNSTAEGRSNNRRVEIDILRN